MKRSWRSHHPFAYCADWPCLDRIILDTVGYLSDRWMIEWLLTLGELYCCPII